MQTPLFQRYVGVDYSGAETPKASLKGLRVYAADAAAEAVEVQPPPSPRRYWSRREIAAWLAAELRRDTPTIVGIDHGFSFPLDYFAAHGLAPDWYAFLDDFHRHWPTDEDHMYVDFVREGAFGNGAARRGDARWRRRTEIRAGAKSVFHFDVPGSVAKSTHAGLPWLLHLRRRLGASAHFWPFDGWEIPPRRSVVAEAYPSLWSEEIPRGGRTPDQHDAYCVASWLQCADRDGRLAALLNGPADPVDRGVAAVEGWILGVF